MLQFMEERWKFSFDDWNIAKEKFYFLNREHYWGGYLLFPAQHHTSASKKSYLNAIHGRTQQIALFANHYLKIG